MIKKILFLISIISIYCTVNCYERKNLCPEMVFKVGRVQVNGYYKTQFSHLIIDSDDSYLFDENLKQLLERNDLQEPDKSFFTGIAKFNDLTWAALDEKFIINSTAQEMEIKQREMQTYMKSVADFKDKVNSKYQAIYNEIADKINNSIKLLGNLAGLKKGNLIDHIFFDNGYFEGFIFNVKASLKQKEYLIFDSSDLKTYKTLQIINSSFSCHKLGCQKHGGWVNIEVYIPVYYKLYDEDDIHCDDGTGLPAFFLNKGNSSTF